MTKTNINDGSDPKITKVRKKTKMQSFLISLWMPITAALLLCLATFVMVPVGLVVVVVLILMIYWGRQVASIFLDDLFRTGHDGEKE